MMDYQDDDCEWGTCPNCQDHCVEVAEQPIWATDQGEIYEIICPVCGVVDSWGEYIDNDEADEFNDLCSHLWGGHQGFDIRVDGQPAHVLGDPNMSPETQAALSELIRCVYRALEDGSI